MHVQNSYNTVLPFAASCAKNSYNIVLPVVQQTLVCLSELVSDPHGISQDLYYFFKSSMIKLCKMSTLQFRFQHPQPHPTNGTAAFFLPLSSLLSCSSSLTCLKIMLMLIPNFYFLYPGLGKNISYAWNVMKKQTSLPVT